MLAIDRIRLDVAARVQVKQDERTVKEYAQEMRAGASFPPVVFHDQGNDVFWLADGRHRVAAARLAGRAEVEADVRMGGERDALLFAVAATTTHGLPRSNADKRRGVTLMVTDPEWQQWSDNEIGRAAAVSPGLVRKVRGELSSHGAEMRWAVRNGKPVISDTR
jgi:ParB-like nuclease domain